MLTITEKKNFLGLLISPSSLLIAKHNLIQRFNFTFKGIQYSVNVELNQFNPTYESIYSAVLNPADILFKFNMFNGNVADIIQVNAFFRLYFLK